MRILLDPLRRLTPGHLFLLGLALVIVGIMAGAFSGPVATALIGAAFAVWLGAAGYWAIERTARRPDIDRGTAATVAATIALVFGLMAAGFVAQTVGIGRTGGSTGPLAEQVAGASATPSPTSLNVAAQEPAVTESGSGQLDSDGDSESASEDWAEDASGQPESTAPDAAAEVPSATPTEAPVETPAPIVTPEPTPVPKPLPVRVRTPAPVVTPVPAPVRTPAPTPAPVVTPPPQPVVPAPTPTPTLPPTPTPPPQAGQPSGPITIASVNITSSVARGGIASASANVLPAGATCSIQVSNASAGSALGSRVVPASGAVSWTWTVSSTAPIGTSSAKVTCADSDSSAWQAVTYQVV